MGNRKKRMVDFLLNCRGTRDFHPGRFVLSFIFRGGDGGRPKGDGEGRGGARPMAVARPRRRGVGAGAGAGERRGGKVSEGILGGEAQLWWWSGVGSGWVRGGEGTPES